MLYTDRYRRVNVRCWNEAAAGCLWARSLQEVRRPARCASTDVGLRPSARLCAQRKLDVLVRELAGPGQRSVGTRLGDSGYDAHAAWRVPAVDTWAAVGERC